MSSATTYPIPANEAQRLTALEALEILDTDPEFEFDALARVAGHMFGAPISIVTMMDKDRLWFKSKLGLEIAEIDRKVAICAHTIMSRDAMVVPDLAADERFRGNPLVAGAPNFRFYAGAPVVDTEGHALGTIAVFDTHPRTFTDAQRDALLDVSRLVMASLEARRRALDLSRMALTDHLTGIANRARFDAAIGTEFNCSARSGEPFTVLTMDLDGFKDINDRHGHAAGDLVLREVGRRLSRQVRLGDTLARLGGDEFAVVVRAGDRIATEVLVHRVESTVNQPIKLDSGEAIRVGVSVGLATFAQGMRSVDELLAEADKSLYQAKSESIARRAALNLAS